MKQLVIVCGEYMAETNLVSETLAEGLKACSVINIHTILPYILKESYVSPEALYGIIASKIKKELEKYNCVFFSYRDCGFEMRKFLIKFLKNTFENVLIDCLYVKNIKDDFRESLEISNTFKSIEIPKKEEGIHSIKFAVLDIETNSFTLKENNE